MLLLERPKGDLVALRGPENLEWLCCQLTHHFGQRADVYEIRDDHSRVDITPPRTLVLYIHGYANSFEPPVARAAQICKDLTTLMVDKQYKPAVVAFCWPADGRHACYPCDVGTAASDEVQADLAEVISKLLQWARSHDWVRNYCSECLWVFSLVVSCHRVLVERTEARV